MSARRTATTAADRHGPRAAAHPRSTLRRSATARSHLEIESCRDRTFRHLERCGLTVSTSPATMQVTTPQDFDWDYPATGGALYGQASHGWMASFRRPGARSRMPGLYLAGGSVHPGPGVPMAAISGRLAAQALMRTSLRPAGPAQRLCVVVCRRAERRRPLRTDGHRLHRQRVLAVLRARAPARHGRSARPLRDQRRALRSARQALGDDRTRPHALSRIRIATCASAAAP